MCGLAQQVTGPTIRNMTPFLNQIFVGTKKLPIAERKYYRGIHEKAELGTKKEISQTI